MEGSTVRTETEPGRILGSVGYLSPEQVRGPEADARSDVFALGTALYEMLSGKRTFADPTPADMLSAILNEDPPPLRRSRVRFPSPSTGSCVAAWRSVRKTGSTRPTTWRWPSKR